MSYGMCNLPKNGCMIKQNGSGFMPNFHQNYTNANMSGSGIIKTINDTVSNIPSQQDMAQLAKKLNNVHIRDTRKKKYVNLTV